MRLSSSAAAFLSVFSKSRSNFHGITAQQQRFDKQQRGIRADKSTQLYSGDLCPKLDMLENSDTLEVLKSEREVFLSESAYITSLYNIISSSLDNLKSPEIIDDSVLIDASMHLFNMANKVQDLIGEETFKHDESSPQSSSLCLKFELAKNSVRAAGSLRQLMRHLGPGRGRARHTLLSIVDGIVSGETDSHVVSTITAIAALSLSESGGEDHISVSRASASGLVPAGRFHHKSLTINNNTVHGGDCMVLDSTIGESFGIGVLHALLEIAAASGPPKVDLHILASLFRMLQSNTVLLDETCAKVLRQVLKISDSTGDDINDNAAILGVNSPTLSIDKKVATAAFGLAAEIAPWTAMSCIPVIGLCNEMQLWHAAERICISSIEKKSLEARKAVDTLLDGAFDQHMYRRADTIATQFYDHMEDGVSRYVEARFLHACDTISKAVQKRQYPLVERQVDRVDKAIERVQKDKHVALSEDLIEAKTKVREFALTRLRESNQHDTAHRLATLWNMDYWYDTEEAEKYTQARRERYIQWEDAFPPKLEERVINVPDVLSNHVVLRDEFQALESTINPKMPVIGFDVEWGDESLIGAALLQLSTARASILIDIPALGKTKEGCEVLESTVGRLFASSSVKVLGFSCRQDLSRLRNSPSVGDAHWFGRTTAVMDIKPLIAIDNAKLRLLGLSRVCEHYVGKPLDKSEQCSMWQQRPLSLNQRVYAALDAWACVAIYEKISFRAFTSTSLKNNT